MKMTYPRILLTLACIAFIAPPALAVTAHAKARAKHAKTAKTPAAVPAATDEDDLAMDTKSALSTDYNCELGNKLTVYQNADDDKHIALSWKKQIHRLRRIETTTGANRFENRKYGLLWIGIPTKSILLDTKKGQQLANECKNATQMAAGVAAP